MAPSNICIVVKHYDKSVCLCNDGLFEQNSKYTSAMRAVVIKIESQEYDFKFELRLEVRLMAK